MTAPAIAGYDASTSADFHRSTLRALNFGDVNGPCRPVYRAIERNILSIQRADGAAFDGDQQADLACELSWTAHSVMATASEKHMLVTLKRPGDDEDAARGDRFRKTLARVQPELPEPVRGAGARPLAEVIELRPRADWLDDEEVIRREDEAPASPNRVLSAAEFVGELKPREWTVDDLLLADAGITGTVGKSKDGKSFFLIDLGNAIHTGRQWRGRDVKRGRVVYVCAEGSEDFKYRLAAYERAFAVPLSDQMQVIANAPNLLKKDAAADVIAQIQAAGGAAAVIVDTLNATMTGGDENSAEHTSIYIANLKAIRRATGAQIIYVHHFGKNEDRGQRGHSSLPAAVDAELTVTREGDRRCVTVTKAKGAGEGAAFPFELRFVELGRYPSGAKKGEPWGSCVVEPVEGVSATRGEKRKRPRGGTTALQVLLCMEKEFRTSAPLEAEVFESLQETLESEYGKPARAREYFKKALRTLADTEKDKWLHRHPGGRISLHPAIETAAEDFDR